MFQVLQSQALGYDYFSNLNQGGFKWDKLGEKLVMCRVIDIIDRYLMRLQGGLSLDSEQAGRLWFKLFYYNSIQCILSLFHLKQHRNIFFVHLIKSRDAPP